MFSKGLLLLLLTGVLSIVQAATDIVIPLYSYPGSSQWQATFDAIQAYPNVRFQVIINPDSGPKSSSPDAAFAAAAMQLKSYTNVQMLGYVRTGYANRPQATVTGEVDQYAAWPDASKVQGIFYDETAQNAVDYMTAITTYARTRFNEAVVMFNPGTSATTAYYNIADFVMIAEIPYSATAANAMINLSAPTKAAVIIYSVPSLEASQSLVSTAISNNIGSVYFTQDPATYQQMGTDWNNFVGYMSAGQASASSSMSSGRLYSIVLFGILLSIL